QLLPASLTRGVQELSLECCARAHLRREGRFRQCREAISRRPRQPAGDDRTLRLARRRLHTRQRLRLGPGRTEKSSGAVERRSFLHQARSHFARESWTTPRGRRRTTQVAAGGNEEAFRKRSIRGSGAAARNQSKNCDHELSQRLRCLCCEPVYE